MEDGDTEAIESYLAEACSLGTEGLMVKTLDDNATYRSLEALSELAKA